MKRNLFRLPFPLILFALILLGTARLSAQEAYAVFTANDSTLTFYYDELKAERNGDKYTLNVSHGSPEWYSRRETIVQAVFDESFLEARPTTTSAWFVGMSNLREIVGIENLKTDNVTDMSGMFWGCSSLSNLDVSGFNTANVVFMGGMFEDCSSLTSLDVSGFNTSSVIDIGQMFYKCSSLTSLDVSGFNTEKACDMVNMFYGCSSLTHLDLSGFDSKNVTDMYHMFAYCSSLVSLDISHFNTRNVTSMLQMFEGCKKLTTLDLSSFVTDSVVYMGTMFYNCTELSTVYVGDGWNTDNLTTPTEEMFRFCYNLVGGAGTTYDSRHLDAEYARVDGGVDNPGYFTQKPREAYAVLSIDSTSVTFYYDEHKIRRKGLIIDFPCSSPYPWANATLTTATFDNSFANFDGLTSLHRWFSDCTALTTINGLSNLNTANVVYMGFMFANCSSLETLDVSNFNTSNVTDMSHLFSQCKNLKSLDLSRFDTKNTTNIGWMFNGCSSLSSLDLSSFDTKNVSYMDDMFWRCSSLTSLDLSSFNTENVTTMLGMFSNCPLLTNLDLSSFDTKNVTDMKYMFEYCRSLNTIFVGERWTTEQVTAHDKVFNECTSLVGGAGTTYDASHVDAEYARIDDPDNGQPGYFTAKYVGDVNGDSSVNVSDVTSLVGIILGNSEPNSAADVNKDGEVNVSDVTAIVSIILGND